MMGQPRGTPRQLSQTVSRPSWGTAAAPNTLGARPPKYDGKTDVEQFISDFVEQCEVNVLSDSEALVALKSCLFGEAIPCKRGRSIEEIVENLRLRFGISIREAKVELASLQQGQRNFHQLADEVIRLTDIVLGVDFDTDIMQEQRVDYYTQALEDRSLQRLLLIDRPQNLVEAVKRSRLLSLGERKKDSTKLVAEVRTVPPPKTDGADNSGLSKRIKELEETVKQLAKAVLESRETGKSTGKWPGNFLCFYCREPGHYQAECSKRLAAERSRNQPRKGITEQTEKSEN